MDRTRADYLFIFPLKIEAAATLKRFRARLVARWRYGKCYRIEIRNRRVDLVIGGVSRRPIEVFHQWQRAVGISAHRSLSEYQICLLGFAGALSAQLEQGHVCWFEELRCLDAPPIATQCTSVARQRQGVLLTSPTMVAQQRERLDLWGKTQADAVDMEAYWLARELQAHDQKLSCCRVISDDGREDLPDWIVRLFEAKTKLETVQRVLEAVATHRQAARWMWKMNGLARTLSQRLADEVEEVLK